MDINALLAYGYEVDDNRVPAPDKNQVLQATLTNHYVDGNVNIITYTLEDIRLSTICSET